MSTVIAPATAPSTAAAPTTVKAYLRPIDRDGLMAFADKGRNNPSSRGTNKVHTVMEGQYRSLSYVGNHTPVVVDEPLHLFGQDTAPAPGEIVLSGLGGCLAVGVTAVATHSNDVYVLVAAGCTKKSEVVAEQAAADFPRGSGSLGVIRRGLPTGDPGHGWGGGSRI